MPSSFVYLPPSDGIREAIRAGTMLPPASQEASDERVKVLRGHDVAYPRDGTKHLRTVVDGRWVDYEPK